VSSVSLASEDPVDEDSPRNYYLGIADYFFTGILHLLRSILLLSPPPPPLLSSY
jgi:hypothetical protein